MAKLYCRYGAMGSSKTANALMVRYNYIERGQKVIMLKPQKEKRDGEKVIKSRIGLEAECMFVEEFEELIKNNWSRRLAIQNDDSGCLTDEQISAVYEETDDYTEISAVIVDEAQFLSKEQIDFLSDIVDYYDIPVICYLLRTDFQGNFLIIGTSQSNHMRIIPTGEEMGPDRGRNRLQCAPRQKYKM